MKYRYKISLFRKNRKTYFFSDKKENEKETFQTKDDGVHQIIELICNNEIEIMEAHYLFGKLMKIRHLPTAISKPYTQFYYDLGILKKFEKIDQLILSLLSNQNEVKNIFPRFVFHKNYKNEYEVFLIRRNGDYIDIETKATALSFIKQMYERKDIDLDKKNLMEEQIKKSKLLSNNPEEKIHLN